MHNSFFILAILCAGVSLSMGTLSFAVGLKNKDKTFLSFGIMSLSLFLFLVVPPSGFIVNDGAPYPFTLIFKRIFIFSYYITFPWFIFFYTGRNKSLAPLLITLATLICFTTMATSPVLYSKFVWRCLASIIFVATSLYGIHSGIQQYRSVNKAKATWFLFAMIPFFMLSTFTAINEFGDNILSAEVVNIPIHLHALLLIFIMGLHLVFDVLEKYNLEKAINTHDRRIQAFLLNVPLFILELDPLGKITYSNPFTVTKLGYKNLHELLNQNCFDLLGTHEEIQKSKAVFEKAIRGDKTTISHRSIIKTKTNEILIVNWVYYHNYSQEGKICGLTTIGRDITNEENTGRLLNQLRLEIEKENIIDAENIAGDETTIIGTSKALGYALQKARLVATTHAPVLLEGETGVGKELFADLIHNSSSRNTMPLVKVNCGALPKELIEDELFGHEKGAFTSAIQSRKGRFELADGGTIFLDEIGELPLDMQPKLLRVLQNGEFERVGGQKTIKVDVRIIAATNRDLAHEVSIGRYRDDLFYRLNVYPITIPSLRKRKEDLPALINFFIAKKTKKYNKHLGQISKADLQRLMDHSWPGNVRELENLIERSVIASDGNTLRLEWSSTNTNQESDLSNEAAGTLEQIERNHILKIMEECGWRINGKNGAAERLDMNPNTLRSKMKKLGITRPIKNLS